MVANFLWTEKYRPKTISDTVLPTNLKDRHNLSSAVKAYWGYGNTPGDTIAAVQDTGAAGVNMAQGTASKQPVLITGANVRTGVI